MSYTPSISISNATPFAQLTRSSYASGAAQWNVQSQTWVSAANTWAGDGLVMAAATCLYSGNQIIASTYISGQTSRHTYASNWSNGSTTRVSQDDIMIGYGSTAAWGVDTAFAGYTYRMDHTRARAMVMRIEP